LAINPSKLQTMWIVILDIGGFMISIGLKRSQGSR